MAQIVQNPAIGNQGNKKTEQGIADSSFLMNLSYDSSTMQLTVTMKNGSQYIYHQVYPQVADDFMQSDNKGEYYGKVIRGKHPSTRLVNKTTGPAISKKK